MVDFFKFKEQVNLLHHTALLAIKFTAEISDTETTFLDPVVYRGTQWICSSKYLFFMQMFAGWEMWKK